MIIVSLLNLEDMAWDGMVQHVNLSLLEETTNVFTSWGLTIVIRDELKNDFRK